jgi:hypothetical protein
MKASLLDPSPWRAGLGAAAPALVAAALFVAGHALAASQDVIDLGADPGPVPAANAAPATAPAGTPPAAEPAAPAGTPIAPSPNRIANPVAVFSGLDKITGRITSFDVYIDETVQFGSLQVTPRVCYDRPPTEAPQTDAFVEVDEIGLDRKVKRIFTGWMFAASPGLHAVDNPVYDVWLTDCKLKSNVPPPKK